MSHSPGPWKWVRSEGDHGDDLLVDADDCNVIEGEWAMGAANARLIAAAPDMLKLLRKSVAHHVDNCEACCLIASIDGEGGK